ncbi:23191_t:CDS:2 [Dentiscutata erythropus]|uniref:23191_t:CDS:1 n=1 Tax=Dentiscutata erythropus TaxID=1348616 RepID=A0A9N9B006_9GLOM|nr:23191_t:CDS:2 [Dentiscutata erythropus]
MESAEQLPNFNLRNNPNRQPYYVERFTSNKTYLSMNFLNVNIDDDDLDPTMDSQYVKGMIAICSFSTLSNIACIIILICIITQKHTRNTTVSHLVTNLLLSDFFQSIGFMISYYWISIGMIREGTICEIQGFLINFGDTSSASWTLVISFHTYALVVHNYEHPNIVFVSMLIVWTLNLMISLAGFIVQTPDHHFYDTAGGAWCWISDYYDDYRIGFHYGIILSVAALMIVIYAIMLAILYNRQRRMTVQESKKILQSVNKKLVWYPLAYILLVTPLANESVPLSTTILHLYCKHYLNFTRSRYLTTNISFYIFNSLIISGCIFTCAGLTDSIIYGITRNVVSVKSVMPKLQQIAGIHSKPSISRKILNDPDSLNSFSAKTDLASFISVTKTRQIRISIIGTSVGSSVLNNNDLDEIDLDETDFDNLKT